MSAYNLRCGDQNIKNSIPVLTPLGNIPDTYICILTECVDAGPWGSC